MQANGLIERFNQTLQGMLVKFATTKKEQWSMFLDTCVYAYNTSRQESTQFTPFELMFGRRATLPVEVNLRQEDAGQAAVKFLQLQEPILDHVRNEQVARLEEAKQNIISAQEKQKATYDRKHAQPDLFVEGQLVLKKDFKRKKRKGGKLDMRFLGPYIIKKALSRGVYELVSEDGKSTVRATGAHLKPYHRGSPDPSTSQVSP